jgi:hypothetical protein
MNDIGRVGIFFFFLRTSRRVLVVTWSNVFLSQSMPKSLPKWQYSASATESRQTLERGTYRNDTDSSLGRRSMSNGLHTPSRTCDVTFEFLADCALFASHHLERVKGLTTWRLVKLRGHESQHHPGLVGFRVVRRVPLAAVCIDDRVMTEETSSRSFVARFNLMCIVTLYARRCGPTVLYDSARHIRMIANESTRCIMPYEVRRNGLVLGGKA